jgi:hypothetical protein
MIRWVRFGFLLSVAVSGAALWAYGIAVLQPLCEPGSPWWDYAENNSYWARDLRWGAVVATCLALIVLARGALRETAAVMGGAIAWLGLDMALDRIDPGRPLLWPASLVSAVAVTVVAVGCARAGQRAIPRSSRRAHAAVLAIGVLSATTLLEVSSPTDAEPALAPARLASVALHVAVVFAAGLGMVMPSTTIRAMTVVGAIGSWSAALLLMPEDAGIAGGLVTILSPGLLLAALWRAGRPALRSWVVAAVTLGGAVVLPPIAVVTFLLTVPIAPWFTSLAGNQAVNAADWDVSYAMAAVLGGLAVFGTALFVNGVVDGDPDNDELTRRWRESGARDLTGATAT